MNTPTPSIPGVDRDALVEVIHRNTVADIGTAGYAADAALAHIAARHKCPVLPSGTSPTVLRLAAGGISRMHLGFGGLPRSLPDTLSELADALEAAEATPPTVDEPTVTACDRDHADEWVEVDAGTWFALPEGVRVRREWVTGVVDKGRRFIHRDDLPDPDADHVERMAKALFASYYPSDDWGSQSDGLRETYRRLARAALAAYREGER